jgi:hypothetical protein
MPLLAGLLVTLFSGLVGLLTTWLTKKVALVVAAIATFGALTIALVVAMQALVAGLLLAFPEVDPVVLTFLWVAVPDNLPACVAACIGADTAVALYRWNSANLRLAASVT